MGEGEGGGEGSVTEGTFCCEVPCVNAVHFRCVILEIENERSKSGFWPVRVGSVEFFWAFWSIFA